jgi:hypothetical protein
MPSNVIPFPATVIHGQRRRFAEFIESLSTADRQLVEKAIEILPVYTAHVRVGAAETDEVIGFGAREPRP